MKIEKLPTIYMIVIIVDRGNGSKVLDIARESGVQGGTVFYGIGTANRNILDYLGLNDKKKEIIILVANEEEGTLAIENISREMEFDQPNKGIAYVEEVLNVWGTRSSETGNREYERGEEVMYNAIYTIVDRGKADEVIDAAQEAGSMGGTVIHARGSGIGQRQKVFNITIEPEKEIVLILSKVETTEGIVNSIREKMEIDKPGKGIIYVTDVKKTYGIRTE